MINSVVITNHKSETIELSLREPEKSGLFIRDIQNISPEKANINLTNITSTDGSIFNSSNVAFKNITLNIGYLFSPTIEIARHRVYKYFPIKKYITLVFNTDERSVSIGGYVESNEVDIFSKEEGSIISILCPFPYFSSDSILEKTIFGISSDFVFPFSNESLYDDKLIFGNIKKTDSIDINYEGDVDVGFVASIALNEKINNFSLYNITTKTKFSLSSLPANVKKGDEIIINSITGQKKVYLKQEDKFSNIINNMSKESKWLYFVPGINTIAYRTEPNMENVNVYIRYRNLYGGV